MTTASAIESRTYSTRTCRSSARQRSVVAIARSKIYECCIGGRAGQNPHGLANEAVLCIHHETWLRAYHGTQGRNGILE